MGGTRLVGIESDFGYLPGEQQVSSRNRQKKSNTVQEYFNGLTMNDRISDMAIAHPEISEALYELATFIKMHENI